MFVRCLSVFGTSWFTEYTSQISMSNISSHVSEESLEINIGGSGGRSFLSRSLQVLVVFSEDFRDGSILKGVRFVNSFSPKFLFEKWF
jgi:hypothetical protein